VNAFLGSWRGALGMHGRGCRWIVAGESIGRTLLEKHVDAGLLIEGEKLASGLVAGRGQFLLLASPKSMTAATMPPARPQ
jgi:hypothetical protein